MGGEFLDFVLKQLSVLCCYFERCGDAQPVVCVVDVHGTASHADAVWIYSNRGWAGMRFEAMRCRGREVEFGRQDAGGGWKLL
ncbi:hypothetical protein EMIT051CA3_70004 [Pseudomonas chlororaphis]